ncbi:MAG: hypothetical protein ACREFF_02820 [Candidatus Udaeobacter sp.]
MPDLTALTNFAKRYTKAWCSHEAESVAKFFGENGSLKVNDAESAVERAGIAELIMNLTGASGIPCQF